jgi:hypothetical protein
VTDTYTLPGSNKNATHYLAVTQMLDTAWQ